MGARYIANSFTANKIVLVGCPQFYPVFRTIINGLADAPGFSPPGTTGSSVKFPKVSDIDL